MLYDMLVICETVMKDGKSEPVRSLQRLRWPHQVTYDVVAKLIRTTNTWAV